MNTVPGIVFRDNHNGPMPMPNGSHRTILTSKLLVGKKSLFVFQNITAVMFFLDLKFNQ